MDVNNGLAYILTSFRDTSAVVASVGYSSTDRAAKPATNKATVVKKPKTACARLRAECMLTDGCASRREKCMKGKNQCKV